MRGCVYDASQTREIGRRQGRDGLWSVLGTVDNLAFLGVNS